MFEAPAGIQPKASVTFTLHVHLDDGTTKDITCVGQIVPEKAVIDLNKQAQNEDQHLLWAKKE